MPKLRYLSNLVKTFITHRSFYIHAFPLNFYSGKIIGSLFLRHSITPTCIYTRWTRTRDVPSIVNHGYYAALSILLLPVWIAINEIFDTRPRSQQQDRFHASLRSHDTALYSFHRFNRDNRRCVVRLEHRRTLSSVLRLTVKT